MILLDLFDMILLNKGEVFTDHLRNVFAFQVPRMGEELDPSEAHKLSRSHMLAQDSIQADQALQPSLVIIRVVDGNACVSLPDEKCLRYCLALLATHGTLAPPCHHALQLEEGP